MIQLAQHLSLQEAFGRGHVKKENCYYEVIPILLSSILLAFLVCIVSAVLLSAMLHPIIPRCDTF